MPDADVANVPVKPVKPVKPAVNWVASPIDPAPLAEVPVVCSTAMGLEPVPAVIDEPAPPANAGKGLEVEGVGGHRFPLAGREVTYIANVGDPVTPGTICPAVVQHTHNWQCVDLVAVAPKGAHVSRWYVSSAVLGGSRVPLGTPGSWTW